jgi:excisionase family DNA binding protein
MNTQAVDHDRRVSRDTKSILSNELSQGHDKRPFSPSSGRDSTQPPPSGGSSPPATPPDDVLLKTKEVAEMLRIHERTVRNLVERGELTAYRVGPRNLRFSRREVLWYLRRRKNVDVNGNE